MAGNLSFIDNIPPEQEDENESTVLDKFSAGLALQNPLSMLAHPDYIPPEYFPPDPGYRPMDDPIVRAEIERGYEADLFLRSESTGSSADIISRIRVNERLRKEADTGVGLAGEMFGGVFNPIVLAPVAAAPFTGGMSLSAIVATEMLAEGVNETLLHGQQPLRTKVESAINIGAVGVLTAGGGVLARRLGPREAGDATSGISRDLAEGVSPNPRGATGEPEVRAPESVEAEKVLRAEMAKDGDVDKAVIEARKAYPEAKTKLQDAAIDSQLKKMAREIKAEPEDMTHPGDAWDTGIEKDLDQDKSIGAAQAAILNTPQSSAGEVQSTGWFGKIVAKTSPAGDIVHNSVSKKAKNVVRRLVDTIYRYQPGEKSPHAVETRIKQADGDIASMNSVFNVQLKKYTEGGGKLSETEFATQVSVSMRNGDVHGIPEIQATAKFFRKFDQNYFEQADKLGIFGDRVPVLRGAKSHLQRIYDRQKITDGYSALRSKIAGKMYNILANDPDYMLIRYLDPDVGFNQVRAINFKDLPNIEEIYGKVRVVAGDEIAEWEEEALSEAADEISVSILQRMLSGDIVDISSLDNIVPKAGSLHERSLGLLSDSELFPYMIQDARQVMSVTSRQMTREIEMTKEFGSTNMKSVIREIEEEYTDLIAEAKTGAQRRKLLNRRIKDVTNIRGMRDLIMGTYGRPKDPAAAIVKFGLMSRTLAMLSYGTNITTSSLSDLVAPALRYGFAPFADGFKVLRSPAKKEYWEYVQSLGLAVEAVTNQRALALSDLAFTSKFSHDALRAFGKYTGLNLLTDTSQALNAIGTSRMWLNWAGDWSKVSKKNKAKLLDVGLDEEVMSRINGQTQKYGRKKGDITLPESHLWDDKDAAMQFENALRKEVHSSTLIPGKGDVPLFLKTETGRFFGMFTSFMLSSQQRWILAGMQRRDAEFMTGLLMLSTTGMLVSAGKDFARGIDTSEKEWYDVMLDGMDRGGALGLFAMPMDIGRMIAGDTPSRYIGKSAMEMIFVPPGAKYLQGTATPLIKLMKGDELNEDDAWKFIRSIPLANSFHAVDLSRKYLEE